MTDLSHLEALARAATPEEWSVTSKWPAFVVDADGNDIAQAESQVILGDGQHQSQLDAAYIAAANPAAILALIERVRVAEAQVAFNQQTIPMAPEHKAAEDMHKSMAEGIRRVLKDGTWP